MTKAPDSNSDSSPEALDVVEALVASAQGGDVDSLNELFQRYHQTMVDMARRKLGPRLRLKEDPDDLAQTTFREAARDSLRLISQAGWLDYAIGYYEELVRMDPFGPGREESAAFFEAIGRDERAAGLRHVVVGDG